MPLHKLQSAVSRAIVSALLTSTIAAATPAAAKEEVLYTFTGGADAEFPNSPLTSDSAGNLYGTAGGGAYGDGTVFELASTSNRWIETVLYSFSNSGDGAVPIGSVLFDRKGNLYGVARQGGASGFGTVFELSPSSTGGWKEQTLYAFPGGRDGAYPSSGLTSDDQGNLYGITQNGGSESCQRYGPGCGTIFELKRSNDSWKEYVLYSFPGGDNGDYPTGLARDRSGDLYGTTFLGGGSDAGVVFKLSHSAGQWQESVVHAFTGGRDGSNPSNGVTLDNAGNLYGVSQIGSGGGCIEGCGLVFEMMHAPKGKWKEIVLHRFKPNNHDGIHPSSTLIIDSAENLYGTTYAGGAYGMGIVFELMRNFDGKWAESVIQDFIRGNYGADPGTLFRGKDGNLYGTMYDDGTYNAGVVFQVSP